MTESQDTDGRKNNSEFELNYVESEPRTPSSFIMLIALRAESRTEYDESQRKAAKRDRVHAVCAMPLISTVQLSPKRLNELC